MAQASWRHCHGTRSALAYKGSEGHVRPGREDGVTTTPALSRQRAEPVRCREGSRPRRDGSLGEGGAAAAAWGRDAGQGREGGRGHAPKGSLGLWDQHAGRGEKWEAREGDAASE